MRNRINMAAVLLVAILIGCTSADPDSQAFSKAEQEGTVAAWETYLSNGGKRAAEVRANQLPEAAFREAMASASSSGWTAFLKRFPGSPRALEVRAETLPAAICREARAQGSLDALQKGIAAAGSHACRYDLVEAQCRIGMDVPGLLEVLRAGYPEHATTACRTALHERAEAARGRITRKAVHPEVAAMMLAAVDAYRPGRTPAPESTKIALRTTRTLSLGSMAHRFDNRRLAQVEQGILAGVQSSVDSVTEPGFIQVVLDTDGAHDRALVTHYSLHPDAGHNWAKYCQMHEWLGGTSEPLAIAAATVRVSLVRARQTSWESHQARVALEEGVRSGPSSLGEDVRSVPSCEEREAEMLTGGIGYEAAKLLWK